MSYISGFTKFTEFEYNFNIMIKKGQWRLKLDNGERGGGGGGGGGSWTAMFDK